MGDHIEAPFYPVIFVRGYAATMDEIEDTTADPYMGFNRGSAVMRQDHEKRPRKFVFESPLLRLMKDHEYTDAFHGGGAEWDAGTAPARSVWIFRYYEPVSGTLGEGERRSMEQFGADLREFILEVRQAICGDDAALRDSFRVHLVAHSMGGLICRTYLQNICRHGALDPGRNDVLELEPGRDNPHYVDKVFTYGTPHSGIEFLGNNVPNLGPLDRVQVANFNRDRMREYLALDAGRAVNSLDDAFPPDRFFCFIGSNYRDYEAFYGLSKRGTGAMSDGLVMMSNAYVEGAPRAVAHRSHSGHYGIVNSESGYQNLQRFLFGDVQVTALLQVEDLQLPKELEAMLEEGRRIRGSYYFDVTARVRGAATYALNERRFARESAILKGFDELVREDKPVYLFTGYLLKSAITRGTGLTFTIDVGVRVPLFEVDRRFWFDDHHEGFLYEDSITMAVREGTIRYGTRQRHGRGRAPRRLDVEETASGRRVRIPLETAANARPGFQGELVLAVADWL